jgi:molybdopterin-guanine dinucleotide biosynthesis protein A
MGAEKGLISFGGKPLITYPVQILSEVCGRVLISANSNSYDFLGLPVFHDQARGGGPMIGIYSGLLSSETEYNLVLSCDMPMITATLLEYIIASAEGCTAAIAFHRGFAEPLCGIYHRSLIGELESHISGKKFKLITFLEKAGARFIEINESLPFYHPNLLLNVNTPQDIETGEKLLLTGRL